MRLVRAGAIAAVAAAIVTAWIVLRPAIEQAIRPGAGRAVTYYVSPDGRDAAAGTSPAAAWRTLARAARAELHPGDKLLFAGGHEYSGQLRIGPGEAGDAARPVLVSSYGSGRATLTSRSSGIVISDTAGVSIRNLALTGRDALRRGTAGILAYRAKAGGMARGLLIGQVEISGFGRGIEIGAAHDEAGYRDVRVTDSVLRDNLDAGFESYGPAFNRAAPGYANAGLTISGVRAYGNHGDPANTTSSSGSGIVLGSVRDGSVTKSLAFENGGSGGIRSKGPVGIWAYDSTGVVLSHDTSYRNSTASSTDGGGFGLDQNTSDSVMEYDLSYGNHGPGFLLYAPPRYAAQSGNTVRFNISYGDGRGGATLGGIAASGRVTRAAIYQNTVVMASTGDQVALKLSGPVSQIKVLNNIFVASPAGAVVANVSPVPGSGVLLAGNDYAAPAGSWLVRWGQARYRTLPEWRAATGQERVGGKPTGLTASPGFTGPVPGPGISPGISPGTSPGAGFQLGPAAPLRRAGLDLRREFGIEAGPVTFSGAPYLAAAPNQGAQ